jgi:predicted dehydrogenase
VYVEKPLGHNIWEEVQTVKAARDNKRIVQLGTQQRSDPMQAQLRAFLHEEKALGKPKYVVAARIGARESIGKRDTPLVPPKSVDYNLWVGPAKDQPIFRDQLHYDWHWDWNTGCGEMGNWGVHVLDDVRNVALLDKPGLPSTVTAGGGRVAWNDAGNTPNVHFALFESESIPVLLALSNLKPGPSMKSKLGYTGPGSGYVVYCEGGMLAGQRGSAKAFDTKGKQIKSFKGDGGSAHAANFFDAVRSRDHKQLNADVEIGHHSSSWCHLANVACGTAKPTKFDRIPSRSAVDAPWTELVETMRNHLADHGVDLSATPVTLSQPLKFDTKAAQFTGSGSEPANKWVRREYREGFVVEG